MGQTTSWVATISQEEASKYSRFYIKTLIGRTMISGTASGTVGQYLTHQLELYSTLGLTMLPDSIQNSISAIADNIGGGSLGAFMTVPNAMLEAQLGPIAGPASSIVLTKIMLMLAHKAVFKVMKEVTTRAYNKLLLPKEPSNIP